MANKKELADFIYTIEEGKWEEYLEYFHKHKDKESTELFVDLYTPELESEVHFYFYYDMNSKLTKNYLMFLEIIGRLNSEQLCRFLSKSVKHLFDGYESDTGDWEGSREPRQVTILRKIMLSYIYLNKISYSDVKEYGLTEAIYVLLGYSSTYVDVELKDLQDFRDGFIVYACTNWGSQENYVYPRHFVPNKYFETLAYIADNGIYVTVIEGRIYKSRYKFYFRDSKLLVLWYKYLLDTFKKIKKEDPKSQIYIQFTKKMDRLNLSPKSRYNVKNKNEFVKKNTYLVWNKELVKYVEDNPVILKHVSIITPDIYGLDQQITYKNEENYKSLSLNKMAKEFKTLEEIQILDKLFFKDPNFNQLLFEKKEKALVTEYSKTEIKILHGDTANINIHSLEARSALTSLVRLKKKKVSFQAIYDFKFDFDSFFNLLDCATYTAQEKEELIIKYFSHVKMEDIGENKNRLELFNRVKKLKLGAKRLESMFEQLYVLHNMAYKLTLPFDGVKVEEKYVYLEDTYIVSKTFLTTKLNFVEMKIIK